MATLIVYLDDFYLSGLPCRNKMCSATGLAIQAFDLHYPNITIVLQWWRDCLASEYTRLGLGIAPQHITRAHVQITFNYLIDWTFKSAKLLVIYVGKIEIQTKGIIGCQLCACQ